MCPSSIARLGHRRDASRRRRSRSSASGSRRDSPPRADDAVRPRASPAPRPCTRVTEVAVAERALARRRRRLPRLRDRGLDGRRGPPVDELGDDARARRADERHLAQRAGGDEICDRDRQPRDRLGGPLVAELAALGRLQRRHVVEQRRRREVGVGDLRSSRRGPARRSALLSVCSQRHSSSDAGTLIPCQASLHTRGFHCISLAAPVLALPAVHEAEATAALVDLFIADRRAACARIQSAAPIASSEMHAALRAVVAAGTAPAYAAHDPEGAQAVEADAGVLREAQLRSRLDREAPSRGRRWTR